MVGSVVKQGQPFALLRVDNLLYQVKAGRLPRPELRTHHRRSTKPRSCCARSCRTPRANGSSARHAATAGEGAMNSTLENRIMPTGAPHVAFVLAAGRSACSRRPRTRRTSIQSITSSQQGGVEVVRVELRRAAGRPCPAASSSSRRRASPSTCPAWATRSDATLVEHQPGQRALGERGAVAASARGWCSTCKQSASYRAELQGKSLLVMLEARPAPAAAQRRPQPTQFAPAAERDSRRRCATSTSAAAPTVPAASSSICRATRSASTSASRARAWWSSSSARRLPESLRRRLDVTDFGTPVRPSRPSRAATACAW